MSDLWLFAIVLILLIIGGAFAVLFVREQRRLEALQDKFNKALETNQEKSASQVATWIKIEKEWQATIQELKTALDTRRAESARGTQELSQLLVAIQGELEIFSRFTGEIRKYITDLQSQSGERTAQISILQEAIDEIQIVLEELQGQIENLDVKDLIVSQFLTEKGIIPPLRRPKPNSAATGDAS